MSTMRVVCKVTPDIGRGHAGGPGFLLYPQNRTQWRTGYESSEPWYHGQIHIRTLAGRG